MNSEKSKADRIKQEIKDRAKQDSSALRNTPEKEVVDPGEFAKELLDLSAKSEEKSKTDKKKKTLLKSFEYKLKSIPHTKKQEILNALCEIIDSEDKDLLKTEIEIACKKYKYPIDEIERYVDLFLKSKPLKRPDLTKEPKQPDLISVFYKKGVKFDFHLRMNERGIFDERKLYFEKLGKSMLVGRNRVITVPIILLGTYLTQNNELMYEVKIGNEPELYYNKENLIRYLNTKTTYIRTYLPHLRIIVNIVLEEQIKLKKLKPGVMFPAIGVFLDKGELRVVYPGLKGIKVYGENAFQRELVERVTKKGLDLSGDLVEAYYNIKKLRKNTIPEICKYTIMGMVIIEPFFEALKEHLSIFPNLFWFNINPDIGKTTDMNLMNDYCFGTEMKSEDKIKSISRFTLYSSESTISLHIDDLDKISDSIVSFVKSSSTKRQSRVRLRPDSTKMEDKIFNSFIGSGNYDTIIAGHKNQALRDRCFVLRAGNKIDPAKTKIFNTNYKKIKNGKVLGPYVLQQSIDYINSTIKGNKTSLEKLQELIEKNKQEILIYIKKKNIELSGPRRLEMYALLYTGLQFWKYIFDKKGLVFVELQKVLDLKTGKFLFFIEILEKETQTSLHLEMEDIVMFFERQIELPYLTNTSSPIRRPREFKIFRKKAKSGESSMYVVQADFIRAYNKTVRGKDQLTIDSLERLGDFQSVILKREIKPKIHRFTEYKSKDLISSELEKSTRALEFALVELKEAIGFNGEDEDEAGVKGEEKEEKKFETWKDLKPTTLDDIK